MKLDKRLRLDRFRSCVAKDRNLILVRERSSGSEGLRTFPGARSSGWIVHSILAVPFFPPLTFLLATPSSSLEQTRSSHSSDSAPLRIQPPSHEAHFDLGLHSRETYPDVTAALSFRLALLIRRHAAANAS